MFSLISGAVYLLPPQRLRTILTLTPSPHRRQLTSVITHHQEQDEAQAGAEPEEMVAG